MSISTSDRTTISAKASFSETSISETYNAAGTTGSNSANGANASETKGQVKLTPAIVQQQFNLSIVQSSLQVSLNAKNDPLALVYKSAIENINHILKPVLGDNAIESTSSQDNSPEATAGRILSFVKSAFSLFQQSTATKNNSASDTKANGSNGTTPVTNNNADVDNFFEQIKKGIEKGFKEARDILESLKVLNGDIASNIDKTYDLVQKGLSALIDSIKNPKPDNGDGNSSSVVSESVSLSISVSASSTTISG